jgi:hypothetical protein
MSAPLTAPLQHLRTFRKNLLGVFPLRRDALFELIDALLLAHDPRSPQELALSPAFRRRWGMVHDALCHGELDPAQARALLAEAEPPDALTIAGCAVYGLDSTIAARPDAETLNDRGHVYSTCAEQAVVGHQYSWLGRLVSRAPAWFAPRDVERIPTASTPAAIAAVQVTRFVATVVAATVLSVIVADSGYAKVACLSAFVGLTHVCVLVRLASNRVLYGAPLPAERNPVTGKRTKRGRPPVHGAKFALKSPPPPEQHVQVTLGGTTAQLSAWSHLHFKGLPRLEGLVVRVLFLKADGTPKYRRPLWLFWSGPGTMALEAIAQMYLARYGIEHFFRFAKQRLGLLCAQAPTLAACETWVWLVAFAYTQLLLARSAVTPAWRPWDPQPRSQTQPELTAGQVLNAWATFSHGLGTPAAAPRPSGKGTGRQVGDRPTPRPKCPVISKKPPALTA